MARAEDLRFDLGETLERLRGRVGRVLQGGRDGRGLRVGMACSCFNGAITDRLLAGALAALGECRVDAADVTVAWVPGAFELPLLARSYCLAGSVDAVVCLGAVIRGETGHYDLVAGACARGLQDVAVASGLPLSFGVLTTEDVDQALARSAPLEELADPSGNKGWEAAMTAVEMATLLRAAALAPKESAAWSELRAAGYPRATAGGG
jgi:6,7-dimethyl-8-ribityllumazine synthase